MPFSSTSNHDLTLDRRFTTLAPRTEKFMIIQMAIEPQAFVAILLRASWHIIIPCYTIPDSIDTI
jgi:hypothetical protein